MILPKMIALYARVSSQKQADENTIDSQIAALRKRIITDQLQVLPEMEFCDNGYSGAELVRPALERLRDRLATSSLDRLYVHSPDRLSRKMAHQAILIEEFRKYECEIVFLNQDGLADSPEANLLVQMQRMIAEYEREKILERTRRGRKHSASKGNVSVFSGAPYGYRYISKAQSDGAARWEIDSIQSEHVKHIFRWVGDGGCSLAEVARRLSEHSIHTVGGKSKWNNSTIRGIAALGSISGHASNTMDIDSASAALSSLANSVATRLDAADWSLKRDLLKLLIERIEINRDEVRLVYKVPPNPFVLSPDNRGFLQHWLSRHAIALRFRTPPTN